ncbi:MAG TPA: lysylphosphatidylglycerol synthase transmembrane domain-containing protein [Gaiellaceae bacterium]|nr:lysylphosphatidylglycerol synthase transmembrane domain-containing protein [Gaiellaceae bacterium]
MAEPLVETALAPAAGRPLRRYVLLAAGAFVSAGLAWLATRNVDPQAFAAAFRRSDWWYLLPSGAALVAAVASRWLRWWLLFARGRRPPLHTLGRAFLIGYLFNNLLPARPGELARALALRREVRTPVAEALATTAAERVYDVLALVALLLLSAPFLPASPDVRTATIAAGVVAAAAVAAAVAFGRKGARLERLLSRMPGVSAGTAGRWTASILDGLVSLRDLRIAASAAALTAVSWVLLAMSAWALFDAFHLRLGFGVAVLVVGAANLTLLVPASPGGVGVFEAAVVGVLAGFSVDRSAALSYAVALHGLNFFPYVLVGAVALQRHVALVRRS